MSKAYLNQEKRYERELAEDTARLQRYFDTGKHISHKDIKTWFKRKRGEAHATLQSKR